MSPSPSPSPPAPEPTAPPPIQATTASIYSLGRHDDSLHADPQATDANDEDDYVPPEEETSLLPPPTFRPLFTLVTDSQSQETHHPLVYYVFSDDNENDREGHDVATVASLRALDQASHRSNPDLSKSRDEELDLDERFVLLDLEPTEEGVGGMKVRNVASLSPNWAVTTATLRSAPTFEEEQDTGENLMLLLEGIELPLQDARVRKEGKKKRKEEAERKAGDLLKEARKRGGGGVVQGMDELWRGLNEGVGVLDKVIGGIGKTG